MTEESIEKHNEESCSSISSLESESLGDKKGLIYIFSQERLEEEMCLMAGDEEVNSQSLSKCESDSSACEDLVDSVIKPMKDFKCVKNIRSKLMEENAQLLAKLESFKSILHKNSEMINTIG